MIDEFIRNYADYEYALASSQLILTMLGMGALLTTRDFVQELKTPKSFFVGVGFQWLIVPFIAFSVGSLLPIPAGIAVGLILVACVPGGTMSNILTLFGRGNITLSISLTSVTTVGALVTTPLLLSFLLSQYLPEGFSMPTARIARDICLTLIFPLLFGMFLKTRMTTFYAAQLAKWMIRISLLLIVLMVIGGAGSGRLDVEKYGPVAVIALVAFGFTVQLTGVLVGRLFKMRSADSLALIVEATFRNISLAVAVKAIVFPAQQGVLDPIGDAVFFVALLYGGVSLFLTLIPVIYHRRTHPPILPE